jgi:hypothetical protein
VCKRCFFWRGAVRRPDSADLLSTVKKRVRVRERVGREGGISEDGLVLIYIFTRVN